VTVSIIISMPIYTLESITLTPSIPSPTHYLAAPDSRAGRRVASRHRVIDVELDARISSLVRTRESNLGTWGAVSTILNLDLRAGDIKLCAPDCRGGVQGDVLDAHQVFARGKGLGEGDGDLLFA
jgi:hypothetical protein